MPVFRINILYTNRKRYRGHHIVEGIELDTYYKHLFRLAKRASVPIASFDVVQISEYSREATYMRENNLKRMSPYVQNVQPKQGTGKRRRRF